MDALPSMHDFTQGCMTASSWAKTVRMARKSWLKVGVKELAHDFLHHFRRPGRQSKRPEFASAFGDVDTFHGSPSPPFLTDEVNHGLDFLSEVDSQRGPLLPVSDCPFPNRACMFPCTRLSSGS